jgi:hypothetical protein
MPDPIERIRAALAAGPTEGEWFVGEALDGARCVRAEQDGGSIFVVASHPEHQEAEANDNFIAACSPDAIRSLLSKLEASEAERSAYIHTGAALVAGLKERAKAAEARVQELEKDAARVVELEKALQELMRGYVNTLENGRDRIVMLGGQCDDVPTMEASDIHLRSARAAIAKGA